MLMHVPMDTYRKTWWSTSHLPTHRLPSSTTSLKYANQATKAHVPLVSSCGTPTRWAVSIRWTGLRTGLWDWTVGLDSQKVALIRFQSSTHTTTLQYTYITWTNYSLPANGKGHLWYQTTCTVQQNMCTEESIYDVYSQIVMVPMSRPSYYMYSPVSRLIF